MTAGARTLVRTYPRFQTLVSHVEPKGPLDVHRSAHSHVFDVDARQGA
jgi:hypothetical protein